MKKAGAVMPDYNRNGKSTTLLSRLSVILPTVAGAMLLGLLVLLCVNVNFALYQSRTSDGFSVVSDYVCREVQNADAPIGIAKEYTFTPAQALEKDTYLAFYTVHQYVEIYIDGRLVYDMKPCEGSFIKTIGSNWTMLPLYREDAGKEICVNIIPVYENFRNREVEFLIGSKFSICADRLRQDWPQLLLSVTAILVGIGFIGIAVYALFNKHSDRGVAALGLFSVMMGIWRMTDMRFTPLLAPHKPVFMFYISVAMLMIGMVPFIKSIEWKLNKVSRCILDCYCIASASACIIQLLLQIFAGVDLRENIYITHVIIAVGAIVLVGNVVYDRLKYPRKRDNPITKKAPFILVVGVLMDIAAFYVRGTSSGLLFSLMAVLIYINIMGTDMMFRYVVEQERQLAEKNRILAENERQLAESRISTMISQIRPHFIYNTLGSIEQLCELQPEAAAKLVNNFARYLRGNFSELDNPAPIRLSQEMEHIRYYASIEQVRFPDIEIKFDLRAGDFLLPALSVQPLVENSIKHGLMKLPRGGTVTVSSYETDTHYCVSVEDNGVGFDTSILLDERKHIGLRNISFRVQAVCNGTLTAESTPGVGTKVVISIPKGGKE